MDEKEEYTAREAAEILEVTHSCITENCRNGFFPNAYKKHDPYGKKFWVIPKGDLEGVEIKPGRRPKNKD